MKQAPWQNQHESYEHLIEDFFVGYKAQATCRPTFDKLAISNGLKIKLIQSLSRG